MTVPPYPANEAARLKALRDLLILDTRPEKRFDLVTAYCRSRFRVDIALVSLVDADRQWFKSACGIDASETPRDISFCGHAILRDEVMLVRDAMQDERFHDSPLVTGPPFIRFYAAAPLKLSSGHAIGTLCLICSQPRRLDSEEQEHLQLLAHMVSMELEGLGPMENCKGHCLYGVLAIQCPYRSTRHELPGHRLDRGRDSHPFASMAMIETVEAGKEKLARHPQA